MTCTDQGGNFLNPAIGWSTAPYPAAQDGSFVYTATCADEYGQSASASITLLIVAPLANPNVDTFTGVLNSGIFTATWQTYSQQGAGECARTPCWRHLLSGPTSGHARENLTWSPVFC